MIKKTTLLMLCISIVFALSACAGSQKESVDVLSSSEESENAKITVEDVSGNIDYVAISKEVGPIAYTVQWGTPKEIPVEELLRWYTRHIVGANGDNPAALQSYAVKETKEFNIPASEFEDSAYTFFGLEKEYLRLDSEFYDETNRIYRLPMEGTSITCNVEQVQIVGSNVQVYFTLDSNNIKKSCCLTINTSDGVRFISCAESPVVSAEDMLGNQNGGKINEKGPSSASESDNSEIKELAGDGQQG